MSNELLSPIVISQRQPANSVPFPLLEQLSTGVVLLDGELKLLFLNPAAEAIFSTSGKRVLGQYFGDLCADAEAMTASFRHALHSNQPFTQREISLRLPSIRVITLDLTATPMNDGEKFLLLELQERDRFLRIFHEEQLLNEQQHTSSFMRELAHEVKNPLGGVRGAAQLLAKELPDPKLQEYTQVIIEEVDRLSALVDSLLGPRQLLRHETLNIHQVLESICQLLKAEVQDQIELVRDYDPSLPELYTDAGRLKQALLNISRNGIQAMLEANTERPRLTLRTRAVQQFTIAMQRHRLVVRIDIINNGPQISEEIASHLFFPMVSTRPTGHGLGLSIAQSCIHQLGGIIKFQSHSEQTIFSTYLPIEKP